MIEIKDSENKTISVGSVLQNISDNSRGVVVKIYKEGDTSILGLAQPGDLSIRTDRGTNRVSSNYHTWKHIPHDKQTYDERFFSWAVQPYKHYSESIPEPEGRAVSGIMALLPSDIVDWDYGPYPDSLYEALSFLREHLNSLSKIEN